MPKILLALLTFFGVAGLSQSAAVAQEQAVLTGKVVNSQKEDIEFASVYLLTTKAQAVVKTAVTNSKGEFVIKDIPYGQYLIAASAVGYARSAPDPVHINRVQIDMGAIVLTDKATEIEAVDITAQLPMIQSVNGKLILNVENSSIVAGNNALDIVKRAPGVSVDKDDNLLLMGRAGATVTIDGRQTYMTGEQLATFLKSTDGSQIKSVEISTVRSASDDAEGAVGIINITTKKSKIEGFNGSFVASAAQGQYFRGNSSLNLNYKKDKTTFFGNYAYTDNKKLDDLGLERTISYDNVNTVFDQKTDFVQRDRTHNYKIGVECKTSERNIFLLQFTGNNNVEDNQNNSTTRMGPSLGVVDSLMNTFSPNDERFNRYSFNANNEFNIDITGRKLTVDLDYSLFRTDNLTDYSYYTYLSDLVTLKYDPEFERSDAKADIDILSTKVDYLQPLAGGMLAMGLKYSNVASNNAIRFEYLQDGTWEDYTNRTNTFEYTEQISAGYVDYSKTFGKWDIKGGLRGEYTISDGNSISMNRQVKRDYFDLFPSLSVGWNLHENHVFSLSYARKVSRPNYRFLNPFEYYIDKRTYMKGNPYLNPEYTHGVAFNYALFKMFNIAVGHDMTRDAMVESMGQDRELKTSWVIRENLGETNTSYINLTIPARVGTFWTIYNNLTGVYLHFKGPIAGYYVDNGAFMFQAKSMHTFKMNKTLSGEFTFDYNSPFVYNLYRIHERINTDAGLSYNFKDQKSSLKLAVTDIFRSNRNNVSTDFEEFNAYIRQYRDSRTVRLTYTYKFGNLKQAINRKENRSEEKERAM